MGVMILEIRNRLRWYAGQTGATKLYNNLKEDTEW